MLNAIQKRFRNFLSKKEKIKAEELFNIAIRIFRSLKGKDSGFVLELLSVVLEEEIQKRKDSSYVLMSLMNDCSRFEFQDSFKRKDRVFIDDQHFDIDDYYNKEWKPNPFLDDGLVVKQSRRGNDLISFLVNLIGKTNEIVDCFNKEVKEICLKDIGLNKKQIKELQRKGILMRNRFGDRIEANGVLKEISNESVSYDCVSMKVFSSFLWEDYEEGIDIALPKTLETFFYCIKKEYKKLNKKKKLIFNHGMGGVVSLTISYDEKKKDLFLSPVETILLFYFQEKNVWDVKDLNVHIKEPFLQKALFVLKQQNLIISENNSLYYLNQSLFLLKK